MASSHSMAHFATQVEQSWNEKRREDHQHMCHSPYAIVPQWSIWRKILPGKKILWPYRSLNKLPQNKIFWNCFIQIFDMMKPINKIEQCDFGMALWRWMTLVLEFSARANAIGFKSSNIVTKTWSDHYFQHYFDCAYWHWKVVIV